MLERVFLTIWRFFRCSCCIFSSLTKLSDFCTNEARFEFGRLVVVLPLWKVVGRWQASQCWKLSCCHFPPPLWGWPHWLPVEPEAWPPSLLPGALSLGIPEQSPWDLPHPLQVLCREHAPMGAHLYMCYRPKQFPTYLLFYPPPTPLWRCHAASSLRVLQGAPCGEPSSPHVGGRVQLLYKASIRSCPLLRSVCIKICNLPGLNEISQVSEVVNNMFVGTNVFDSSACISFLYSYARLF